MHHRAEVALIGALAVFAVTGLIAARLDPVRYGRLTRAETVVRSDPPPADAAGWFGVVRQSCNPVEVDTRMRAQPWPAQPEGDMYGAACYALAGRVERAREIIESLPSDQRYRAAGVVFEAGHPAADAGDDIAAGPLMELVVEYWPNHYMALYHAGAARYSLGHEEPARDYLERFLAQYANDDGWRRNALSMLATLPPRVGR